jgi:hypothetical protein
VASENPDSLRDAVRCFLSYGSPRFLLVSLAVVWGARFFAGPWTNWDMAIVVGILAFWPVQEWLIHVFVLHFEPVEIFGRTFDFEVPRSHRIHHRDPWNVDILFIPLQGYFIGIPPLLLLTFGLLPTTALALTAVGFYLVMTVQYEWWHFLLHTRVRPKYALHKRLWRNHRLHHCKNEHYWYGVSMTSGDELLRTAPDPEDVETSPTCRTLGFDEDLTVESAVDGSP